MSGRVVIAGGGTGGHIFPGLAVSRELRAREIDVHWLGGRRGLEAELVPERGLPITLAYYVYVMFLIHMQVYRFISHATSEVPVVPIPLVE